VLNQLDPGGAGGAAESALFPAESALFVEEYNFQCLSPVARNTQKGTRSMHETKDFLSPEKNATRKDVT
jgi:hypothetical protein